MFTNKYRSNTMVSSISVAINELSLIENLTNSLEKYINEQKDNYTIIAFGRGGNYFAVTDGYFIPSDTDKIYFESLKDCIVYILKENNNLILSREKKEINGMLKTVYIPGIYFSDSIDTIAYLENLSLTNEDEVTPKFYDIKRKELNTL